MPRAMLLVLLAACGDPAARVQLEPVSPCGQVTGETALRVVAYTGAGEQRRTVPPTEIDAFPADTEQLGVEVIGDSGRVVAVGKTAPLAFDTLDEGTNIPIVMAPLDGVCPVGPPSEPRTRPALARAGDVVLVIGGTGPDGTPLSTAEVYDPATATFVPVDVPPSLMDPDNGLAGAVLTELGDGRVVLSGTSSHALAIFDPTARRFTPPVLFDQRAFHGAFAVAADRLLVIGGCADVVGGTCSGPSLRSGFVYDVADVTLRERGPALDPMAVRHGAQVFDLGEQRDGARRFVLAGGFGVTDAGDRFALADETAERVTGLGPRVAALDGGALLSLDGSTRILAPDAATAETVAGPADGSLVTLEDGSVIAVGSTVSRYSPTRSTWTTIATGLPSLDTPSVLRLADGSVLIIGGAEGAWLYRPSLVGATSGSIVVVPDDGDTVLGAPDPARVDRTGSGIALVASDDELAARALVGGPRMSQGSISAVVTVAGGGVALIAQQTGPGRMLVGRLVPGEPARIARHDGGTETVLCTGSTVDETELGVVTLSVRGDVASLLVGANGGTVKVTCDVPMSERGQWGVAAVGKGARVELGPVTLTRTR